MVKGNGQGEYAKEPALTDEDVMGEDGTPNWTPIVAYPRFDDSGRVVDENCKIKLSKKAAKEKGKPYGWSWQHCSGGEWRGPEGGQLRLEYATAHGHGSEDFRHRGQPKLCADCSDLVDLGKLPSDWQADSYWYFGGNSARLRSKGEGWGEIREQYSMLLQAPVLAVTEGQSDADAVWEFFGVPSMTHCYAVNGPTADQAKRLKGFKGSIWLFADRDPEPVKGRFPGLVAAEKTLQGLLYHKNGRKMLRPSQITVYLPPKGFKDIRQWLEESDWVPGGEERPALTDCETISGANFRSYAAEQHRLVAEGKRSAEAKEFREGISSKRVGGERAYEADLVGRLGNWMEGGFSQFFYAKEEEDSGLKMTTLTRAIESAGEIATGPGDSVYAYRDGLWCPGGEREIKNRTRLLLQDKFNREHAGNAVEWFRVQEPTLTDDAIVSDYINCKNGLLDWRTGELHPHSPDVYIPNQIPVEWNPEATCPEYDRWLSQVVEEDSVDLMHEVHGYALLNDNPLHKAIMFYGSGRNGKGTELRLLRKLLGGRENVSSVSPQELDGDRFAIVETYRKLANIVGDVDARMFEGTEIFKKMTGQDFIRGQRKNGQPFDFMCRALMIASFNEFPRTSDHTEGFWSRWIVIAFNKGYFPDSVKDPEIENRIGTKEELEGILVKAVAGLQRVVKATAFSVRESSKKASEEFQRESDLLQLFVDDAVSVVPGGRGLLRRSLIKEAFTVWLKKNGHKQQSTSSQKFWGRWRKALERIHSMSPDMVKAIESNRDGYIGLELLIDPGTGIRLDEELKT